VAIWMFNAKRSHSLFGVLTAVCAYYIPRCRRPSAPVLGATAFAGALVVSLAIGWRGNHSYEQSSARFLNYLGDFNWATILINLNVTKEDDDPDLGKSTSYETLEYGGYLLMLDAVPAKSDYDFGASYLRVFSTYIPRIFWREKPVFGRE